MKCLRTTLLVALALVSQTAGTSAAINRTMLLDTDTVLLPLPCLESFLQPSLFQDITPFQALFQDKACLPSENSFTLTSSPYDSYYTGKRTIDIKERLAGILRCGIYHRGMSLLAANRKTAMSYVSNYWQQAVAYCRNLADSKRIADNKSPTFSNINFWSQLDNRVFGGEKYGFVGKTSLPDLFGESCWTDKATHPSLVLYLEFAKPWHSIGGNAYRNCAKAEPTLAAPSLRTWLIGWAKCSLDGWNVAFRNISQQIARLDWTLLLSKRPANQSAQNATPASKPIER